MSASPPPRFEIHTPPDERDKLRRWGAWAHGRGILTDYLQALRTLVYRLGYEADEWATPFEVLGHHAIELRQGVVNMLSVTYGIHYPTHSVFIRTVTWRDDYPGGRPPA